MSLNKTDKEDLLSLMENEGAEYAFIDYSQFEYIKDKVFHDLRQNYIEAYKSLISYIEE